MDQALLFQEDSYARSCSAHILRSHLGEKGGDEGEREVELDRTVFFARSGGQQGDIGRLTSGSASVAVVDTLYNPDRKVVHRLAAEGAAGEAGAFLDGGEVAAEIDWDRRYRMMRLHSALHLLCALVPHGVTGGNIAPDKARLDFDCAQQSPPSRDSVQEGIDRLIAEDRPITSRWIEEKDLNPSLVRTLSAQPPRGGGKIRLISIENCDLQPCGGTHVKSTGEILGVRVGKIENKGRHNRRIALELVS